jgi:hypothetical protein
MQLNSPILFMSRPDLGDPFYVSIMVWSGCELGVGISMCCVSMMFYLYVLACRVLNHGQLSIVVSDWEPYLGGFFPHLTCGKLNFFMALLYGTLALSFTVCFCIIYCFVGVILIIKRSCTLITLHLGPLLQNSRDNLL